MFMHSTSKSKSHLSTIRNKSTTKKKHQK